MKKSVSVFILVVFALLLSSCTTINSVSNKIRRLLPNEIKSDLILDQTLDSKPITWYYQNQILEDGILEQPYLDYDQKTTVTAIYLDKSYEFDIPTQSKYASVSKILIDTNGVEVISKDDYITGKISVSSRNQTVNQDISMRIKGRGNSTWLNPKKPYKIKFDERISLLGMKSAKEYVLLAEYSDKSLLRNFIAHKLGSMLNIGYALETRFVEVYFNGIYEGFYLLTEQVETDKNRLNIKAEIDTNSGFLIELEADDRINAEGTEGVHWIRVGEKNYVIKSPDTGDYTEIELRSKASSIKEYLTEFENSIVNGLYPNYIDTSTFIDYFIIQELTKNVDSGYSSVYSFRDGNGVLVMGPLWDFDISMGNGDYFDSTPIGFHALGYNRWFTMLFEQEAFKVEYINRYLTVYEKYLPTLLEIYIQVSQITLEEREQNFDRWDIMGQYVWPNPPKMVNETTVQGQDQLVIDFLNERALHLKTTYEAMLE